MANEMTALNSRETLVDTPAEIQDGCTVNTRKYRCVIAFWLFGLCNDFGYAVVLSAANDILHDFSTDIEANQTVSSNVLLHPNSTQALNSNHLVCNSIGTGAILLADIVPCVIVKMTFPFFMQQIPYNVKIALFVFLESVSCLMIAISRDTWITVMGVVFVSSCAGLGEVSFLSLTTFYHRDVVSAWSSGLGGSGMLGSITYAGLISLGLSRQTALLSLLVIPVVLLITYCLILPHVVSDSKRTEYTTVATDITVNKLTHKGKFLLLPSLAKYMVPLFLVYYCEYFINQGLHELLYFNGEFLSRKEQYRWFQVVYQLGVFVSRSSVGLVKIQNLWIPAILQFADMVLLICQVYFRFIPNMWIIIAIILWEGLLGGSAYVNTYYRMTNELSSDIKEFSIGIASMGNSIGIAIAGAAAIPFHNHICNLNLKM